MLQIFVSKGALTTVEVVETSVTVNNSRKLTAKNNWLRLAKQQFCVHHASLFISLPSLNDYDVKMPNFTFCGGCENKTTFFSFSCTSIQSFRTQLQEKIANI